jgi:hypothetical protein
MVQRLPGEAAGHWDAGAYDFWNGLKVAMVLMMTALGYGAPYFPHIWDLFLGGCFKIKWMGLDIHLVHWN